MPTINVNLKLLKRLMEKNLSLDQLEKLLLSLKGEMEVVDEHNIKVELNDTNRPDLWSTTGIARGLKNLLGKKIETYPFFHSENVSSKTVVINPSVQSVRPYLVGFLAKGTIDNLVLEELIQMQEKLAFNFGSKRSTIGIGLYDVSDVQFPLYYKTYEAEEKSFIPLENNTSMNLKQILEKTEQGKDYGFICQNWTAYPIIEDKEGFVLSMPPIVNSDNYKLKTSDKEKVFFIELTGTVWHSLTLACRILACHLYDLKFELENLKFLYPYSIPQQNKIWESLQYSNPWPQIACPIKLLEKWIGQRFTQTEIENSLSKMGLPCQFDSESINVSIPPYREDFLHPVDVIEEILSGYGLNAIKPLSLNSFSIGQLSPMEHLSNQVKQIMLGLGFQQMIYPYMGSIQDFIEKMNLKDTEHLIQVENPLNENYCALRPSLLPYLLKTEAHSTHSIYPHQIFEIGQVSFRQKNNFFFPQVLGVLWSNPQVNFNHIHDIVASILYYLQVENEVQFFEIQEDRRFIQGRAAYIFKSGQHIARFGEIHPQVLENWSIPMPCVALELDLTPLL